MAGSVVPAKSSTISYTVHTNKRDDILYSADGPRATYDNKRIIILSSYVEKLHNIFFVVVDWQFRRGANGFENCIIVTPNSVCRAAGAGAKKLDFDVYRRRKINK